MTLRRDASGIASPDDFSEVPALPVNWSRIDATTLADSDFTEGELVTASLEEGWQDMLTPNEHRMIYG